MGSESGYKTKLLESLSSSSQLGAGQSWTPSAVLMNVTAFMFSVETDQPGEYLIQVSQDGTNFITIGTYEYRANGTDRPHIFQIGNRYLRIVFNNTSSTPQTYFRAKTFTGNFGSLTVPLNGVIVEDADATVIRNPYDPLNVALGGLSGIDGSESPKYGKVPSFSSGSEVTLWAPGTAWVRGTGDDTVTIYSSSTDDTNNNGSGAKKIRIYGVNADTGKRDYEDITMNGTTDVVSEKTWKLGSINRARVIEAGGGGQNAGNISIEHTGDATLQAYIAIGENTTFQLIYTVADDEKIALDGIRFKAAKLSGGGTPRIEIRGYYYTTAGIKIPFMDDVLDTTVANKLEYGFSRQPLVFSGVDQFYIGVETNTASSFISGYAYYSNIKV